jgi:hypothetical protein
MGLSIFSLTNAQNNILSGYIYSEKLGLISISCSDGNSCQKISYGVYQGGGDLLLGYGFSQNGEWVNFNPNFGGVRFDGIDSVSGWAFSGNSGWINLDGAKIISISDIKKDIMSVREVIDNEDLSPIITMETLNKLCIKLLNNSECNIINY